MNYFFIFAVLILASVSNAANDECYRNLNQYAFTLHTFDNPFGAVGDNGQLIDWESGKPIPFEVNTQNFKSGTYNLDANYGYNVKFTFEEGKLRKAEGVSTTFKAKGKPHVVTFNENCQIVRAYEGNIVRHDSSLCKKVKELGTSKISECHSVMVQLSKIGTDFKKQVEAEGYTYDSVPSATGSILDLLSVYGRCSNIMGWERPPGPKTNSKKVENKNTGAQKRSTK